MNTPATQPAVSIVMPCFNARAHLPMSFSSVLAQTFDDWELIVVDDGSTDRSYEWLKGQRDHRLVVLQQTNQGVSAARNAGLGLARGEYVTFLDADDTWAPRFLETMLAALAAQPQAALAYCGWQNVGLPGGRGQPFVPPEYETPDKEEKLFAGCRWPIHAAMVRRPAIMSAGGFNRTLKNAEDYALWLEIGAKAPIVRVPEVLAYYHFHGAGQASSNKLRAVEQLLAAQQAYVRRHADFASRLGRTRVRKAMYQNLLRAGFDSYWKRDLVTARTIFRRAMLARYGSPRDWLYMLPALLPLSVHHWLIRLLDEDSPHDLEGS
ncbi:glycosyltransferase family 2 protein [Thauera sp. 2A1]|uniref:glycosyltransferase family 2 protein n=1 Tax=Thauera sp. 2A1 TaxID=2570191 RepID=UPI001290A20B|nr:glycosyltransferase [Thauera sp. 2A1]KAI5916685.1 glycosyltransferase [Thauera sp. 2A1]